MDTKNYIKNLIKKLLELNNFKTIELRDKKFL